MQCLASRLAFSLAALTIGSTAHAEDPFRLEDALAAPDWLTVEGKIRGRYESLGGQFRAGGSGGDQILVFRNLALIEADPGPVAFGVELQDSRAYLDDAGTTLSTSTVNAFDLLQGYVRFDLDGAFGAKTAALKLGRQTLNIGSRRVFERVDMANVIFSYTGAYWRSTSAGGDELHALAVVPVGRLPSDRPSLAENEIVADEEQWGRVNLGLHYREKDPFGLKGFWAEGFVYTLREEDTDEVATPNRDYLQLGFRVLREQRSGHVDFEVEAAWRSGTRRAGSAPGDTRDLEVDARMLYAHFGYTFSHTWRPRVAVDYYYASGDSDPTDGRYEQFDRLFGSRRSDLGNTGIHGALTTSNIDAPGARIELTPNPRFDLRVAYKSAYLAEAKDLWETAGLRDPTGASGRFIGHAIDVRTRYWIVPDGLLMEIGASTLLKGRFAREAPNAPKDEDTVFGYIEFTQSF